MPNIVRRVIKIGEKSIGVTIPKEWLDHLGINIGSTIELSLSDDHIIVSPLVRGAIKVKSVTVQEEDIDKLSKIIIASYLEGFDIIEIKTSSQKVRGILSNLLTKLPGILILEKDYGYQVRITVDEQTTDVKSLIYSMRYSVDDMFKLLLKYLIEPIKRELLDHIFALDDDVDRLHFLAVRCIRRTLSKDPKNSADLMLAIKTLEHVGDSIDRIANLILKSNLDNECNRYIKEIVDIAYSYHINSIDSYINEDTMKAVDALNNREKTIEKIMDLGVSRLSRCSPYMSAIMHEALMIVSLSAELGELTMSKYVRGMIKNK